MLFPYRGFGKREKRHDPLHVTSLQCILNENGVLSSTFIAIARHAKSVAVRPAHHVARPFIGRARAIVG
jgi:hypothetical protein